VRLEWPACRDPEPELGSDPLDRAVRRPFGAAVVGVLPAEDVAVEAFETLLLSVTETLLAEVEPFLDVELFNPL
jgi:hypothetical protein